MAGIVVQKKMQRIQGAEPVAPEIEVVNTEAAKEDGKEYTGDLILAGAFVLSVEPGALVVRVMLCVG